MSFSFCSSQTGSHFSFLDTADVRTRLRDVAHPAVRVVRLVLLGDAQVADLQIRYIVHGDLKAHAHGTNLLAWVPTALAGAPSAGPAAAPSTRQGDLDAQHLLGGARELLDVPNHALLVGVVFGCLMGG